MLGSATPGQNSIKPLEVLPDKSHFLGPTVVQVVPLAVAPGLAVRMPLPALAWPKRAGFAEYATPSASMTLIARLMSASAVARALDGMKNSPVPEPKVSVPVP